MAKKLSRRLFLGGAAVSVALPYLQAMAPKRMGGPLGSSVAHAAEDNGVRLLYVHVPYGVIRTRMTPGEEGGGYTLPSMLSSLADVKEDFNILSGLSNRPGSSYYRYPDGREVNDGPGDHARDTGTFLTCRRLHKTDGSDIRNGISVDQVAANHIGGFTSIPSLVVGTAESLGGDSGYSPTYRANISWRDERTPAAKLISPRAIFERLFTGFDPGESASARAERIAREQSILDSVREDASRLSSQLGAEDRRRLEQYLTGVRAIETRLESSMGPPACDPGTAPPESIDDWPEYIRTLNSLIRLAFECDRTRVASYMLEARNFDFLSVDGSSITENHHQMSHLEQGDRDIRRIERINEWQFEQFGDILRQLKGVNEGDGANLLDKTIVVFGGGLDGTAHRSGDPVGDLTPQRSGPVHRHTNLPILVGGRGGGAIRTGRHLVYRDNEPLASLYLSTLHAAGINEVTSFGLEGNSPLEGLG